MFFSLYNNTLSCKIEIQKRKKLDYICSILLYYLHDSCQYKNSILYALVHKHLVKNLVGINKLN